MSDTETQASIPLETIRNLFCMDLESAYKSDFTFAVPFTPHQLLGVILNDLDLTEVVAEFDDAAASPAPSGYSIGCISTLTGSCFAYARYKSNGCYILILASALIEEDKEQDGTTSYNIACHSVLMGVEDEELGQRYLLPIANFCLCTTDDSLNTELIEQDLYASLCYMQQSMATCLAGEPIDVTSNQLWLDPIMLERAEHEFAKLVGIRSVEDAIQTYRNNKDLEDRLLAEIEEEESDEFNPPNKGPQFLMN